MKKLILILVAVCTMLTAYSQTEKGKHSIGGSIIFSSSSTHNSSPDSKSLDFSIDPEYGFFIKDNLAIGVDLNIGYHNESFGNYKNKSNTYGLGIFANKYFNIAEKLKLNIKGNLAYNYQTIDDTNSDITGTSFITTTTKNNTITLNFTPGLVYFATPKLGIQAGFGDIYFSYSKND